MTEVIWFYYGFLLLLFSFLPGYIVLHAVSSSSDVWNLERYEYTALSFGVTVFLIAITYLTCRSLDHLWSDYLSFKIAWLTLFFTIVGASLLLVFHRKKYHLDWKAFSWSSFRSLKDPWIMLSTVFLAQYVFKLCLQVMIPLIFMGGDWYEHYERARFFLYRETEFEAPWVPWSIADRTPLFNIIGAFFMALFSDEYWIFQAVSILFNSILIFPTFMIGERMFGRRIAILSTVFAATNPYMTENALYTWPKNLAAYFVLLFYYFLIRKSPFPEILIGSSTACAVLSHGYAFLFLPGGLLYYILGIQKGSWRDSLKKGFVAFAIFSALLVPWFYWTRTVLGPDYFSRHIYYPFIAGDTRIVLSNSPEEIMSIFFATSPQTILLIRFRNIYRTLFPWTLVSHLKGEMDLIHLVVWYTYGHTLPGAVGLILFLVALLEIFRRRDLKKETLSFIIAPLLSSLIFTGWVEGGLARQSLQPLVPILIIFGTGYLLTRSEWGQVLRTLSSLMQCFDFGVFILWFHVYRIGLKTSRARPDIFMFISTAWEEFAWRSTPILVFGVASVSGLILCGIVFLFLYHDSE